MDSLGKIGQDTPTYSVKQRILINLTQLWCQLYFGWWKGETTYADESTSAFVWRTQKPRWIKWINWIFDDPKHCENAFNAELKGLQNAPEYRAKFDEESA